MGRAASLGLLLIGAALTSPDTRALSLSFDHTFRTAAEEAAVSTWARETLARLPPGLHERLPGTIRVRFRNWGNDAEPLTEPRCALDAPDAASETKPVYETYGRFNAVTGVISINARLVREIVLGPSMSRRFDCYHGNFYTLATASLLHEIAHAYDALELDTGSTWKAVSGFNSRFLGFNTGRNRDLDRLPSPQAAANESEAFAVHLEYFLLDPEYRCRFPSHYEYLENHFSWSPPYHDCRRSYEIVAGQGTRLIDLDPDRIYQVRYLLASPGRKAQSRFGHAMLHIVLCAAGTPRGPECLTQEEEHLVLGFVASTDDSPLRTVNGVTGVYDSRLVFTSLQDQIQKYNDRQFRDLRSYVLDLDRAQTERLIHRALELYWTYRGPYRFLTNNCATELEDLLKAGILDERYLDGRGRTPKGVLKRLIRAGFVGDDEILVYASNLDAIRQAAASVYDAPALRGRRSVDRWMESLSYDRRSRALDALNDELDSLRRNTRSDLSFDETMAASLELGARLESFRLLESSVAIRQETSLDSARQRERKRFAGKDAEKAALLNRLRSLADSLLYGDRDGAEAYGIPLSGERGTALADVGREFDATMSQVSTWGSGASLAKHEKDLDLTRSLETRRYDALMAYAGFARELRISVVRQALVDHPGRTNEEIRAMLERRFGAGSFEATRVSDTRFDRLRQSATNPYAEPVEGTHPANTFTRIF